LHTTTISPTQLCAENFQVCLQKTATLYTEFNQASNDCNAEAFP